jgi:hypothetical protein
MSEESFSDVTHTSWGGRIKASFNGLTVGLILFPGGFPLLLWNEGRAVQRFPVLEEGQGTVISVSAEHVDPANQGHLVHISGIADAGDTLSDATFGVSRSAIHLKRTVEMYQCQESR